MEEWVIRCLYCDYERPKYSRFAHLVPPVYGPEEYPDYKEALRQACAFQAAPPAYTRPGDYCCTWAPIVKTDPVAEPIALAAENSPGVETDDCVYCNSPEYSDLRNETYRCYRCEPEKTEDSPGVEVNPVEDQLPECSNCFGDGYIEDEFGFIKSCQCEPKLSRQKSQSAIAPAAKLSLSPKSDRNPISTGISLSDRFLARYAPPQVETFHFKPEADGQLSLVDFTVVSNPEPPDPDDFDSLDAFREAIALWDVQNPEPLAVSMDSMCEWAPCPWEWYEPEAEILPLKASSMIELPEQSEVMELWIAGGSSSSDFSIPTFGAWCDRSDRSDEPPDTGIFARLPRPKPPNFPPRAIGQTHTKRKLNAFQSRNFDTSVVPQTHIKSNSIAQVEAKSKCRVNTYPPVIPINSAVHSKLKRIPTKYPETIPRLSHRVVAGSSTQPARSPPGGDAM